MTDRVLVLGGGVAGMSAAHELAERGFRVTVVEVRHIPGGKARSLPVPETATDGREALPAEHGFRFFPGFYRHLPDTMSRIPYRGQTDGVFGNLRDATGAEILRHEGKTPIRLPVRFPRSPAELRAVVRDMAQPHLGLSAGDVAHFVSRLFAFLTSCEERRFGQYEYQSWWEFSGAEKRSHAYRRFLADGLTRTLVAARAHEMSARTGASILLQLVFDIMFPGRSADRLLCGPTNDVWIGPWLEHLRGSLGVDYRLGTKLMSLQCEGKRITGVTVKDHDGNEAVLDADWYVAAVPVHHMAHLSTPAMKEAEPALANLGKLHNRWMNGILFYLREDVPIVPGHVIYIDSEWSLTSISQRQFWADGTGGFGAGDCGGILSVDVSDWTTPGRKVDKPAMDCTHEEIVEEVLAQLRAHFEGAGVVLDDTNIIRNFLDTDVKFPQYHEEYGVRKDINLEPLLVNTTGSWDVRPEAVIGIDNLFLAGDYVRTYTDLATMEGANEAARRAVNGILERSRSNERPCDVWPLHEPRIFAPARALDRLRYRRGRPHETPPDLMAGDSA
jgi:uncharacterized protein with NAD-binding domain and iron-sulfur cluster